MMKPVQLETKLGSVWVTVTQANHACITFLPDYGVSYTKFAVRGVPYSGSIHTYLHKNGVWQIGMEHQSDSERSRSLYMSDQRPGKGFANPTEAARATAALEVMRVYREWASAHPDHFNVAEKKHIQQQLESRREKRAELMKKVAELDKVIAQLQSKL